MGREPCGQVTFRRVLVLGGVRSGKSTFAERLAAETGRPVLYVATATAGDAEMAERIAHHRARRPASWRTVEAPTRIVDCLTGVWRAGETILLEDLTLLLSNLMGEDAAASEALAIEEVRAVMSLPADLIVVTNEVGMGIVPPYPLGRQFRDALGRVNQAAAALAGEVYVLLAGLPLQLK